MTVNTHIFFWPKRPHIKKNMAAPLSSEGIVTDSYKTYRDTYRITYQILQYVSFVEKVLHPYRPGQIKDYEIGFY